MPELPATVPAASPRASTPSQPRFTFDDLQEPAGQDRHPGGPHFLTLLALFGSVGLNVYLGWIAWDTYNRYQDLVADMRRGAQRVREGRRTAKPAT